MLGSGIVPGAWITKQFPMLVNKDFQIWNLIGGQHFTGKSAKNDLIMFLQTSLIYTTLCDWLGYAYRRWYASIQVVVRDHIVWMSSMGGSSLLSSKHLSGSNILVVISTTNKTLTQAQKHNHYDGEWATSKLTQIARFMGPTWGPSGANRTQVGPRLAPWFLLSGESLSSSFAHSPTHWLTHSVILQRIAPWGQKYPHMNKWYATRNLW